MRSLKLLYQSSIKLGKLKDNNHYRIQRILDVKDKDFLDSRLLTYSAIKTAVYTLIMEDEFYFASS